MIGAVAVVAINVLALIALSREVGDYYYQQLIAVRPNVWRPDVLATTRARRTVELVLRDFESQADLLKVAADVDVLVESFVNYDRAWASDNKDRILKKWQGAVGM